MKTINAKKTLIFHFSLFTVHLILCLILSIKSYAACTEDVDMGGKTITSLANPLLGSDAVNLSYVNTVTTLATDSNTALNLQPYFWINNDFFKFDGQSPFWQTDCSAQLSTTAITNLLTANHIHNLTIGTASNTSMLNTSNIADCVQSQVYLSGYNFATVASINRAHSMITFNAPNTTAYIPFTYNGTRDIKSSKAFSVSVLLKSNGAIDGTDMFWLAIGNAAADIPSAAGFCSLSYTSGQHQLQCGGTQQSALVSIPYDNVTALADHNLIPNEHYYQLQYNTNDLTNYLAITSANKILRSARLQHKMEMQFFKKNDTTYLIAAYWDDKFIMAHTFTNVPATLNIITLGAKQATNYKIAVSGLYGIPIIY